MPRDAKALRAARKAAKLSAEGRIRVTPKSLGRRQAAAREAFARRAIAGQEPLPAPSKTSPSPEQRQLARLASLAKHGKADPRYLQAFSKYFYRGRDISTYQDDDEFFGDDEDDDEG